VVDLLVSPLELVLQVNELPQVVRVDILDAAGPNLDLRDRDQDLESILRISCRRICFAGILFAEKTRPELQAENLSIIRQKCQKIIFIEQFRNFLKLTSGVHFMNQFGH
jgi:hypothetical protein